MKRTLIQYCCWMISFYSILAGAWAQSLILEEVAIHSDRQLYASGDTIWLKLYVTDAMAYYPSTLSAIAYVELWDIQGDILFQTKVPIEKGMGLSHIHIPPTQETGEYLIRAYTRWMANGPPENFAHQPIIIFNPLLPIPVRDSTQLPEGFTQVANSSPDGNFSLKLNNSLDIELSLNKTILSSREKVVLDIITKDSTGSPVSANLSLSVAKNFPVDDFILFPKTSQNIPDESQQQEANQLPDLYGLNLSGSVFNRLGQRVRGATVFFCLPGPKPVVQFTKSTADGWFRFLLPDLYGNHEILISATDEGGRSLEVKLDPDILGGRPILPDWSFTFPQYMVKELQQYSVEEQLKRTFQSTPSLPTFNRDSSLLAFYSKADQVFILDEFTRFSMAETFTEIVYSATLYKRQKRPYIRVFDDHRKQMMRRDPLILIDGVPVPDIEQVLSLSSKEVERIEVVTSPYYLYGNIYDGIIHVITFEGDAASLSISKGAIKRPYAFLSPEQSFIPFQPEKAKKRIPDIRHLLHWAPMIQTNKQGKARISFWSSDVNGSFKIQVLGLSAQGLRAKQEKTFEVIGQMP